MNPVARCTALALAAALALAGCETAPPTKPAADVPQGWRETAITASSLAERPWGELFRAEELDALIREALAANSDLRIAAERVELARAQFGIQRSALFPDLSGQFGVDRQRFPAGGADENVVTESALLGLALSPWEIDLWGRVRAATESARRQLLSSEEVRLAAQASIVAQVASLYVRLLTSDEQLLIARRDGGDAARVASPGRRPRRGRRCRSVQSRRERPSSTQFRAQVGSVAAHRSVAPRHALTPAAVIRQTRHRDRRPGVGRPRASTSPKGGRHDDDCPCLRSAAPRDALPHRRLTRC